MDQIEPMKGYVLTPVHPDAKRRLAFCSGRQGNLITLMLVNGLVTGKVTSEFGREYCQLNTPFGRFNLSPCGVVSDLDEVARVCDIIRMCPD